MTSRLDNFNDAASFAPLVYAILSVSIGVFTWRYDRGERHATEMEGG